MNLSPQQTAELHDLLWGLRAGTATPDELARLERWVCEDAQARAFYVRYIHLCADLHWAANDELPTEGGGRKTESGTALAFPSPACQPPILDLSVQHSAFSIQHSYVGGVLFSYMIAAVILGTALAVAWMWKLPDYQQVVRQTVPLHSPLSPLPSFVGQITGMVDCQWSDPNTATIDRSHVPLGRKYALASGLMEITYDTGAKVILQGPVTYEVESAAGGYLSVGKLTANVEKKDNLPSPGTDRRLVGREAGGEGSGKAVSPLSTLHSPLFSVRTPTATVTDLGTEFGVEVSKEGNTTSHVFRGSVRVQVASADGKTEDTAQILHENEAARVKQSDGKLTMMLSASAKSTDFVRNLVKPTMKTFDLVDVVAGGDGFSGRRNRGIDPTTGQVRNVPPKRARTTKDYLVGDRKYHRVESLPLVDGVFIPDGSLGPMQVDSVGNVFADFPKTSNQTDNYIWAGGVIHFDPPSGNISTVLGGIDYASPGHGVLYLQSNLAITFSLDAVRRANPNHKLTLFCAVAGNTEAVSVKGMAVYADIWVLVDGQKRFRRREISSFNGAFPVLVNLSDDDHFLTLVCTDGGNGITWDFVVFGDPRLDLIPIHPSERRN